MGKIIGNLRKIKSSHLQKCAWNRDSHIKCIKPVSARQYGGFFFCFVFNGRARFHILIQESFYIDGMKVEMRN